MAGKTYPELSPLSGDVEGADVLAAYRSPGPLRRLTASTFADYIKAFFSASGGAALIGFTQAGTGAVARTQQDKNRDVVSIRDLGCAADGSTDDTTAFAAALTNAAGRTIRIPAGQTVKINGAVSSTYTGDIIIIGDPGASIDLSGGGTIDVGAGDTALPNLSANITAGSSTTATFAAAHGLVEGDVFKVCNPTDFSQSDFRLDYRAGRMFRVQAVLSSTQVRFFGTSPKTFTSGSVTCWKLNGGRLHLENLTITPPTTGTPVEFSDFRSVRLRSVRGLPGSDNNQILLFNCYDIQDDDPQGAVYSGDAYPRSYLNCQKGVFSNLSGIYSTRHPIAFGSRDVANTVPCADFVINGFQADTVSANGIGAIDSHPNCDNIQWSNGTTEGAVLSGSNAALRNATVRGRAIADNADGLCIDAEMNQGTLTVENVRLETFGDASNAGVIRVDLRKRNGPCTIILRNITCFNPNAMTRGLHLLVGTSSPPAHAIKVIIDGWTQIGGGSLAYILSVDGTNDVETLLTGQVRNITGTINGLVAASTNENYGVMVNWPSTPEGVTNQGDADIALNPRTTTRTQYFGTTLTADRTVTFTDSGAANGDKFEIVRTAGGAFNLTVLGVTLAVDTQCTVEYRGRAAGAGGAFVMTSKGPRV